MERSKLRIKKAGIILHNALSRVYDALLDYAYEMYKAEWCKARCFDYVAVERANVNGEEYCGQMYVCKGEFEDTEWNDEDFMQCLLSDDMFALYKEIAYAVGNLEV